MRAGCEATDREGWRGTITFLVCRSHRGRHEVRNKRGRFRQPGKQRTLCRVSGFPSSPERSYAYTPLEREQRRQQETVSERPLPTPSVPPCLTSDAPLFLTILNAAPRVGSSRFRALRWRNRWIFCLESLRIPPPRSSNPISCGSIDKFNY